MNKTFEIANRIDSNSVHISLNGNTSHWENYNKNHPIETGLGKFYYFHTDLFPNIDIPIKTDWFTIGYRLINEFGYKVRYVDMLR